MWQSHKPLGAYDLLPAIAEAGFNSAPPTVYRALDFLQEQGLVHRIASLNAFIGCTNPEHPHQGYFLICQACGVTVELNSGSIERVFITVQTNWALLWSMRVSKSSDVVRTVRQRRNND
ncbi:Fur family transcriptional regulator [Aliamphritea spongicola]